MINEQETARALDAAEPVPHGDKPWLITFADLFCVLLAFFALIFSMSKVETGKWRALTQAFSHGVEQPLSTDRPVEKLRDAGGLRTEPGLDLGYLGTVLEAQGKSNILLQKAAIYMSGERLVLSLSSDLLFAPGSATFDSKGAAALFDLAGILRNIANDVEVVGHTDPTPIENGFASNWDLSLARAEAVAIELKRAGFPRDVNAYGDADAHFAELPAGLPEAQRFAMARRVDIVLTPSQGAF